MAQQDQTPKTFSTNADQDVVGIENNHLSEKMAAQERGYNSAVFKTEIFVINGFSIYSAPLFRRTQCTLLPDDAGLGESDPDNKLCRYYFKVGN